MADTDRYEVDEEFAEDEETEEGEEALALDDDLEDLDSFETLDDEEVTPAVVEEAEVEVEAEEDTELDEELEEDLDEELDEELDDEVVEDEGEAALDVVLTRTRAGGDDEDLGRLEEPRDLLTVTAQPIGAQEFTCRSCFLVKNRAQLADTEEMICFDCA